MSTNATAPAATGSRQSSRLLLGYLYLSVVIAAIFAVFPVKDVFQMHSDDTSRLILFSLYYGLQAFLSVVFIAWLPVLFGFGLWDICRRIRRLYRRVHS